MGFRGGLRSWSRRTIVFVALAAAYYVALNIALMDRSGAVLWYKIAGDSGGFDLRDGKSAKAFVQRLVADFPVVGR